MGEGQRDPPLIITTMARWVEFADDECIVPICLQVPARLLPLPTIEFAGREVVSPQPGGDWKMDSRIHKFYRYGLRSTTEDCVGVLLVCPNAGSVCGASLET